MVAVPFMLYHRAMRLGCSTRRYHRPVMMVNSGMQPASNRPRKKRQASRPAKSSQAAMQVSAMPQPRMRLGMRMRWGTLTMRKAEKGCQASWAMGAMVPMSENWLPSRPASSWRS